jgi:hypothetical protein
MGEKEGEREMCEFETRRLWAGVARGIREGDFELASREKTRIEVGFDRISGLGFPTLPRASKELVFVERRPRGSKILHRC